MSLYPHGITEQDGSIIKTEKGFNGNTITRNNTNFRLFLESNDAPRQNSHIHGVKEVYLSDNCGSIEL